jgi:hypothetical protein
MELYVKHEEFVEVNMKLEKLVKTGMPELVAKTDAKAELWLCEVLKEILALR